VAAGQRGKKVDEAQAVQFPIHSLRVSGLARGQDDRLKHLPRIHQVVGCRLRNWPSGEGVIQLGLGHKMRAARHVAGMEDVVVFEGEIGIEVGAGKPLANRTAAHQALVLLILRHRKGVHHVFDRLLIPGSGVGMRWSHVRGNCQANHVPPILLGLGVARTSGGRLALEEAIRLGREHALDALARVSIQTLRPEPQ